uniref:RRM domain-containing protein n=1 Tax=Entomoneis paludosa TaxID=265537 RepID=A0A7S2V9X9_9STRA|mmetsp:Transcript_11274/g.23067  ORF Transcript_11274/g.23067 Transcript_11274/m.23067 type:complete len:476 (+) Transcript_11274:313-1740(+)|eukprot:CAMPEP_0172468354 /NCGR_PEP_ID=MMETSP1065-20121228/61060_1 /TAXON_ID=265537 /ORGANISM="Amphiprora paludosa, Strain CCMP125" /LENGTH=475 /DNA_ID=CAMNT_0013225723 /DNA_START=250 /DNA_END=1677 /DNA_ORIENTATION=-
MSTLVKSVPSDSTHPTTEILRGGDDPKDTSGDPPQQRNDDSNPQQGTGGLTEAGEEEEDSKEEDGPTPATTITATTSAEEQNAADSDAVSDARPAIVANNNETANFEAPPSANAANVPSGGKSVVGSETTTRRSLAIPPFKKDSRKLFVGGLPADITDDEFRAFFEKFGELMDSVVMFDYETHRSRGFGFVTFKDPEVSRQMLMLGHDDPTINNNNGTTGRIQMRDKLIEIKAAEPKEGKGRFHHNSSANHRRANQHGMRPPFPHQQSAGLKAAGMSHTSPADAAVAPVAAPTYDYQPYPYQYDPNYQHYQYYAGSEGEIPAATYPYQQSPYYYPPSTIPPGAAGYAAAHVQPTAAVAPAGAYVPVVPHSYGYAPAAGAVPTAAPFAPSPPAVGMMPLPHPVAFFPVVASPPSHPQSVPQQAAFGPPSVMQPAAPGIPAKPEDATGGQHQSASDADATNSEGTSSATANGTAAAP